MESELLVPVAHPPTSLALSSGFDSLDTLLSTYLTFLNASRRSRWYYRENSFLLTCLRIENELLTFLVISATY